MAKFQIGLNYNRMSLFERYILYTAYTLLCRGYTLYMAGNGQSAESPIVSNKHANGVYP